MILGTAGHVDHGKTALVKALTGVDTDRLAEERRRGLTIELGFAPLALPGGRTASVVDVPGHEKFVPAMLSGAAGMDAVLLAVAADEGVMPQTVEHLGILALLGVGAGLLVLTKADLADGPRLAAVERQVRAAARGTALERAPCLAVSAKTGAGLDALRAAIAALPVPDRPPAPFRLHVDRAFSVDGSGLVVTGTVAAGAVCRGDAVELAPAGLTAKVRGLQRHGTPAERLEAGERAAVNLSGVKTGRAARGDTLCAPGTLVYTDRVDVSLSLPPGAPFGIRHNAQLRLHHGARALACRCVLLGADALSPGGSGFAQLRLAAPLAARPGDRYVLRLPSPAATLGGGLLLDLDPPRRGRNDPARLAGLDILAHGAPGARVDWLLARSGPVPLAEADLARDARVGPGDLTGAAAGGFRLAPAALEDLRRRAEALLRETPGLNRGALLGALCPGAPPPGADAFLTRLLAEQRVRPLAGGLYLPGDAPAPPERGAAEALEALYRGFGLSPPANGAVEADFPGGVPACRRAARALLDGGALVALSPQYRVHAGAYRGAVDTLRGAFGGAAFTLAQARDALGVSRRYALLLLEYLDKRGVTKIQGAGRALA